MRISDWSSDVCSSDLAQAGAPARPAREAAAAGAASTSVGPLLPRLRVSPGDFTPARRGLQQLLDRVLRSSGWRLGDVIGDGGAAPPDRTVGARRRIAEGLRSEEHTSELQSLMRISYAVFCLKKKKKK